MVSELSISFPLFTPPPRWSLCRQYASYWNAFLFFNLFPDRRGILYFWNYIYTPTTKLRKGSLMFSAVSVCHSVYGGFYVTIARDALDLPYKDSLCPSYLIWHFTVQPPSPALTPDHQA